MSYAIMRIEKRSSSNIGGMFCHNERKTENHSNEDINKDLSHLNYQLIECKSYKEKINQEIKERYKVNKSIRKDAVLCAEVVFTSDKEFFDKLTPEQEKRYFEKSIEFLKEQFGEKNVVFATVHKDETTPHLHAGVVPLTDDGRLSYKSYVNTKYDLVRLQDKYYEKMSLEFPELERGRSSQETNAKHLELEEYKLQQEKLRLEEQQKFLQEQELSMQMQERNIRQLQEELEKERKKIKELKEKLNFENEKYYKLDEIVSSSVESKKIFSSKTTVKLDKELYNSLLKYASEGEKLVKKFNDYEEKLSEYELNLRNSKKIFDEKNRDVLEKVSRLEKEKSELQNEVTRLRNVVSQKNNEISRLEKLEKWLPNEVKQKFVEHQKQISRSRGMER